MKCQIRKLRKERGWTQPELSHRSGVRVAAISEMENGKANPTLDTMQAIASAFGVTILDLFEEDGVDPGTGDLVRALKEATPEEIAAIRLILRGRTSR